MDELDLRTKIAHLARELGWNQQTLARRTSLNRQTVLGIFRGDRRPLRNATVQACAAALGLTARELTEVPAERLLLRLKPVDSLGNQRRRQYELAMQPEVRRWMEENPTLAADLDDAELDELLSLHGVGGPLTAEGVAEVIDRLERRRKLVQKVIAVAGTEQISLLEAFVDVLYDKVQPYRDRK